MGSNRISSVGGSSAPDPRPIELFVSSTKRFGSSREIIVALARHVATISGVPEPSAFAADSPSTGLLTGECTTLQLDVCTPDLLGQVWEMLLSTGDRRSQGAHFTPQSVTTQLVSLSLDALCADNAAYPADRSISIWDPACGGGAFLLAACRDVEHRFGWDRQDIVSRVYASDIDATALDVTSAALELWAGGHALPRTHCGDALLSLPPSWPTDVDVIVGNPPFLGQLTSDTTRSQDRRRLLSDEFGSIAGAYLDEAGLFIELCRRRMASNGVVGLVLPESILGSRDAELVRSSVQESNVLHTLWVDDGQSFAASVDVVGVVIAAKRREQDGSSRSTRVVLGVGSTAQIVGETHEPAASSWAALLAFAQGVPPVALDDAHTIGERADITAGFRQHFYGLHGAVENGSPSSVTPSLVTSGVIEPLDCRWGSKPVKFAGNMWESPTVRLEAIEDDAVREWFEDRAVPKLLLASQTRVVEAVADPGAVMVPSVPVVSVEPHDADDLWHLAALLTAPAVTAWMLYRAAGTGLSHDAIRVRAATLAEIPVPADQNRWDAGAALAQLVHNASAAKNAEHYVTSLRDLARMMDAAYGVSEEVGAWWWGRIRLPEGFTNTPYCV